MRTRDEITFSTVGISDPNSTTHALIRAILEVQLDIRDKVCGPVLPATKPITATEMVQWDRCMACHQEIEVRAGKFIVHTRVLGPDECEGSGQRIPRYQSPL